MRIVIFALGNLAAIFAMAVIRVFATGRIDHHHGYAGSILQVMPSSAVVAALGTLMFWAMSAVTRRGAATAKASAAIGIACGVTAYAVGWVLAELLGPAAAVPALGCFAVCGAAAPLFTPRRTA
jgi:hypothetical protein